MRKFRAGHIVVVADTIDTCLNPTPRQSIVSSDALVHYQMLIFSILYVTINPIILFPVTFVRLYRVHCIYLQESVGLDGFHRILICGRWLHDEVNILCYGQRKNQNPRQKF